MFVQQIVPAVSLMKSHLRRIPFLIISIPMNAIGLCFDGLQGIIGMKRMAYLFVIPNLLLYIIFGVFPILLNFHYGFSGGTSVIPSERPFVGTRNFEVLLDCRDYLDANSCATDLFWRGVHNTVSYVFFEVSGIMLVSLMTAQVLNRKIRARGFFRGVFFYPVLLSSVVVALLWGWILQRTGLLNGLLIAAGLEPINFLFISAWAKFWTVFVGIWANLGFYTLIIWQVCKRYRQRSTKRPLLTAPPTGSAFDMSLCHCFVRYYLSCFFCLLYDRFRSLIMCMY